MPVMIPVDAPIPATEGTLLDQEPPGVMSISVAVKPVQTFEIPIMEAGNGFMVITLVEMQPVPVV